MGLEVGAGLLVVEVEIDPLAIEALHRAHAVDAFGQRAIGNRIGFMRRHEAALGRRQPEQPDDEQDRHGGEGQQAQPRIEIEQDAHNAEQQHDVADRQHRGLEEFLHRVDVALQARHQPADLGLVHPAQRHALQPREHGAAHVEQHVLGGLADHAFLDVAGAIVDDDDDEANPAMHQSSTARPPPPCAMPLSMAKRMISGMASWVRVNTSTAPTER